MATIFEDDLKRQIKERDFKSLYFIYGDENYLKQHYVTLITDKAVDKDFKDFNFPIKTEELIIIQLILKISHIHLC